MSRADALIKKMEAENKRLRQQLLEQESPANTGWMRMDEWLANHAAIASALYEIDIMKPMKH